MGTFAFPPAHNPPAHELGSSRSVLVVDEGWLGWFLAVQEAFDGGASAVVPLAKITGGGTDGSLTIVNGVIKAITLPT